MNVVKPQGESKITLPACTLGAEITIERDGTETTYLGVQTGKDSPPYWVEVVRGSN